MSKIEAAERLAEAVERLMQHDDDSAWSDVEMACRAYRSASVPSDKELVEVAREAYRRNASLPWGDMMQAIAAAVREWVQRDGLTDEERQAICDEVCTWEDQYAEMRDSILRKLGREPEPVWEWDNDVGAFYVNDSRGIRIAEITFTSLGVRRWTKWNTGDAGESWTVAEAKAWCEQQLREYDQ